MIILIIIILIIITITIIIIKNKGTKEKKERETERAIMYYYSTVTSIISGVVIFTNHIFSAILHKAKIQHYSIVLVNMRK